MTKWLQLKLTLATCVFAVVLNSSPASAFNASFRWCSGSPEFRLNSVPKGTTSIQLNMMDLQVPSYQHGGGEYKYSGKPIIPCGALNATYLSPSPPSGAHTYRWTIKAIGSDGKVLGQTTVERKFPEF
jgi:hypothetical protein